MWKSGHRDTKGCGSRSLVPGPREVVSLHWEGSSASSGPGTSSPSETDRVPHLSGAMLQTGEISFCSAAWDTRILAGHQVDGHFRVNSGALAPTSLLHTFPLSTFPHPLLLGWSLLLAKGCTHQCYLRSGSNLWPLSGSLPQGRSHHHLHFLTVPKAFSLLLLHQLGLFCEVL